MPLPLSRYFYSRNFYNMLDILKCNRWIMNPYSCFTLLLCPTWQLLNSEPFPLTGKQLKGQTQKTQQAILQVSNRNPCSLFALLLPSHLLYCIQKFRSGVYNVLVATSIGEEGLDIIEVDLVICFDANVSPLRMIQRMGRTGRKHDGQVDILFLMMRYRKF